MDMAGVNFRILQAAVFAVGYVQHFAVILPGNFLKHHIIKTVHGFYAAVPAVNYKRVAAAAYFAAAASAAAYAMQCRITDIGIAADNYHIVIHSCSGITGFKFGISAINIAVNLCTAAYKHNIAIGFALS